jgi:acyl-CoA dehydrogenase
MADVVETAADYPEIREAVVRLCAQFPGEYWRELDRENRYPSEFVNALTEAGYLSVLIPEEYGGSGLPLSAAAAILEEVQRAGCNGAACHAQMYTMGTVLRHGSPEQKQTYLPEIAAGRLRLQAFGVTEPTSGTDTTALKTTARREGNDAYVVNGQKIWTSRAEHSDLMLLLARTTPADQVKKRTDGLSVFLVDMRTALGNGLTIRPIRTMMNHATTEVFFDDLRVPAENLIGEEGRGFRYILSGMNAERILIAAECIGDAKWFVERATSYSKERVVFGRPIGQNQGVQFPIAEPRRRGQHGEDARRRRLVRGGERLRSDAWRLRFRRGIRHRAEVPRNPPLPGRADLDEPHPRLSRRARAWHAAVLLSLSDGSGFRSPARLDRTHRGARRSSDAAACGGVRRDARRAAAGL